jgi:hypothetical protein
MSRKITANEHIGKTVTDHLASQQSGMENRM